MFKKKEREVINYDQIDTVIGSGSEVEGSLYAQGTLRVDGKVKGEVQVKGDLLVGEKGQVMANVKARNVTVAGELKGDLELEGTLEITPTGQLYGDVVVANLIIGEGATFQGNCKMQPEHSKQANKQGLKGAEASEQK